MEKRYYTRYPIICDAIAAFETGINLQCEIRDLSAEGARLRTYSKPYIKEGDILYLNIKSKYRIKVKAQVRWVKEFDRFIEFGVKFIEIPIQDRESLSQLISEFALSTLSDSYLK